MRSPEQAFSRPRDATRIAKPLGQWYAIMSAIVVASFGPYIFPAQGVRTEHLVVYPIAVIVVLVSVASGRVPRGNKYLQRLAFTQVFAICWTLAVTATAIGVARSEYKIYAHLENYLQPIVILTLVAALPALAIELQRRRLLMRIGGVLFALLSFNAILAVGALVFDFSGLLRYFSPLEAESFWMRSSAMSMGRSTGIFNQPIESGLAYSLGLFLWAYRLRIGARVPMWFYPALVAMLVGGLASLSKVFLLGGLPLFFLYWNPIRHGRRFLRLPAILILIAATIVVLQIQVDWAGWTRLHTYLSPSKNGSGLIELYTGGRFGGDESYVMNSFKLVWEEAPLHGFGFGLFSRLDNAYLEFWLQGGLVGLACYLAILVILVVSSFSLKKHRSEDARLLLVLTFMVVWAGLGAPVLTLNRFSTILWVVVATLLCDVGPPRAKLRRLGTVRQMHNQRI